MDFLLIIRRPPRHIAPRCCSYFCNLNILLGKIRGSSSLMKWADAAALKAELEAQVGARVELGVECCTAHAVLRLPSAIRTHIRTHNHASSTSRR